MKKPSSVEIVKGRFENEKELPQVNLWNFAPKWPSRDGARMSEADLSDRMLLAHEHTVSDGFLMLWMPASELHVSTWDMWEDAEPWVPVSTLVSGRGRYLKIGVLYGKGGARVRDPRIWGYEHIIDHDPRAGHTSSLTIKWLLDRLFPHGGGVLCDPYAHRSGVLATYCRRHAVRYIGFIQSQKGYGALEKVLAQVEIPAVQASLL